jgi:TatD DNase family protein
MRLINVHSHHPSREGEISIQNIYRDFEQVQTTSLYSLGLHPWFIHTNWQECFDKIKILAHQNNILAIGETGLDKLCTTSFIIQQEVFIEHIKLANEIKKPIIIHCVKAFNEVIQLLKTHNKNCPVIFHGFHKNIELAQQLIHHGYYLSFGKALQKENIQEIIKQLPLSRLFFETDEATITIQQIYSLAAAALSIDENSLLLQVQKNAQQVFGFAYNQLL